MKKNQFSFENASMAILLHLVLMAFMLTSFHFAIERAKLVAPDRVQITEIDLTNIKITGDESQLYNTDIDQSQSQQDSKKEPEDLGDDKPMENPSMVTSKQENKNPDKSLPKKRTLVRVNRETTSLNRTMTISVVDALRVALTRCWVIDTERYNISDIRAVAHLTMAKNGMVNDIWFESAARAETDPAYGYVIETIRGAVRTCQPFKMLPTSEFDNWEKIQLTFYPAQKTIM